MKKISFFENGAIKEIKISGEKFGQSFYLIKTFNQDESIQQIMEKPNLRIIDPSVHVSGSHIMPGNPIQNHIDHFNSEVSIERPPIGEVFPVSIMNAFIPSEDRKD